jgi:hypothetical protein
LRGSKGVAMGVTIESYGKVEISIIIIRKEQKQ